MGGGAGPQVPQQEVVPVLVNGPFQGLQVPSLKEVLGKDVPGKGGKEGTGQLCHLPRPGGFTAFFFFIFFFFHLFFCTDEELQVVNLRQKSLIWGTCNAHRAWHHPKGFTLPPDTGEDGAAPKLPQNPIPAIKHCSGLCSS